MDNRPASAYLSAMPLTHPVGRRHALIALLVAALASAAILGALAFQHIGGLAPCPLCLQQRLPYYLGIPAALAAAWLARRRAGLPARLLFLALAGLFAYGAGLGIHHSGVEWGFWQGPTDCAAGAGGAAPSGATDLMQAMRETRIVACDQAAWRMLGLSLAGYNALIAGALAAASLWAAFAPRAAHGSSSASQ